MGMTVEVKVDKIDYGVDMTVIGQVVLGGVVLFETEEYLWGGDEVARWDEDAFRERVLEAFADALAKAIDLGRKLR